MLHEYAMLLVSRGGEAGLRFNGDVAEGADTTGTVDEGKPTLTVLSAKKSSKSSIFPNCQDLSTHHVKFIFIKSWRLILNSNR